MEEQKPDAAGNSRCNGRSVEINMMQSTIEDYIKTARYEGPVNAADCARLEGQTRRIFNLMADGQWRTLTEIEAITGAPQASCLVAALVVSA